MDVSWMMNSIDETRRLHFLCVCVFQQGGDAVLSIGHGPNLLFLGNSREWLDQYKTLLSMSKLNVVPWGAKYEH
jgi:hypothetical protein